MEKTSIVKIIGWRGPNPQGVLTPSGNPTAWARGIRNEIRDIIPGIRFRWDRDCKFDVRVAGYAMATPEDADRISCEFGIGVDVIFNVDVIINDDKESSYKTIVNWIIGDETEVYSLRIPKSLKSNLESQAKARGLSLNAYLKNILEKVVE